MTSVCSHVLVTGANPLGHTAKQSQPPSPVPPAAAAINQHVLSPTLCLQECLKAFTACETLDDYNCQAPECKKKGVRAIMKVTLMRCPPVLVLHLKRFSAKGSGQDLKISKVNMGAHTCVCVGKDCIAQQDNCVGGFCESRWQLSFTMFMCAQLQGHCQYEEQWSHTERHNSPM